eukprot:COSAG01_NODE_73102_length_248_cov_0.677632_1_plen_44_part_10
MGLGRRTVTVDHQPSDLRGAFVRAGQQQPPQQQMMSVGGSNVQL